MGEQSNAYRILLRYDRKSRHRRIKKQRRYERLAATSQFRYTDHLHYSGWPNHFSAMCRPVDGCTLSGGRSPYLRHPIGGAHTLASVEPPSYESGSQVGCGLSLFFGLLPACPQSRFNEEVLPSNVWYQSPDESSPHPGVLPIPLPARFMAEVRLVSSGPRDWDFNVSNPCGT